MRLVYFGSGAFGVPTLDRLIDEHEVAAVVTQPDRPAGRHRIPAQTPVAELAAQRGIATLKPDDVNAPAAVEELRSIGAEAFVVIAFGQKLGQSLLENTFA